MRVALVGVTHWHAAIHLDAIRHAGVTLSGVADRDAAAAAEFAARSGTRAFPLPELLAARPDLVVLMGHPATVGEDFASVLAAGLPVMLEKPAASDSAGLAALTRLAGDAFVAMPLPNRCGPIWAEMERLRVAGRLGRLAHAHFRIINGPTDRYRRDGVAWALDPAVAGGGALRNLGIHPVDAAFALAGGAEPAVLAAATRPDLAGERVEGYATAMLGLPDGAVVTIEAGYTHALRAGTDAAWRVVSANATLLDRGESCIVATRDDQAETALTPLPAAHRYRAFLVETLAALRRGTAPPAGLGDYLRAMRLIDRIYEAASRQAQAA